jgi:hypothetical protein
MKLITQVRFEYVQLYHRSTYMLMACYLLTYALALLLLQVYTIGMGLTPDSIFHNTNINKPIRRNKVHLKAPNKIFHLI